MGVLFTAATRGATAPPGRCMKSWTYIMPPDQAATPIPTALKEGLRMLARWVELFMNAR